MLAAAAAAEEADEANEAALEMQNPAWAAAAAAEAEEDSEPEEEDFDVMLEPAPPARGDGRPRRATEGRSAERMDL